MSEPIVLQGKTRIVNSEIIHEIGEMLSIRSNEFAVVPKILEYANYYYRMNLYATLKRIQLSLDAANSELVEKYCTQLLKLNEESKKKFMAGSDPDVNAMKELRKGYVESYENLQIFSGFMNDIKMLKLKSLIRAIDNFFNLKEVTYNEN